MGPPCIRYSRGETDRREGGCLGGRAFLSESAAFPRPPRPPPPKSTNQSSNPPRRSRYLLAFSTLTGLETARLMRGGVLKMAGKTESLAGGKACAKMAGGGDRRCPRCQSLRVWGNGLRRPGKKGWRCADCGKSFVEARHGIPTEVRTIADRMIEERIAAPVIALILRGWVSRSWVYNRKKGGLMNG